MELEGVAWWSAPRWWCQCVSRTNHDCQQSDRKANGSEGNKHHLTRPPGAKRHKSLFSLNGYWSICVGVWPWRWTQLTIIIIIIHKKKKMKTFINPTEGKFATSLKYGSALLLTSRKEKEKKHGSIPRYNVKTFTFLRDDFLKLLNFHYTKPKLKCKDVTDA